MSAGTGIVRRVEAVLFTCPKHIISRMGNLDTFTMTTWQVYTKPTLSPGPTTHSNVRVNTHNFYSAAFTSRTLMQLAFGATAGFVSPLFTCSQQMTHAATRSQIGAAFTSTAQSRTRTYAE